MKLKHGISRPEAWTDKQTVRRMEGKANGRTDRQKTHKLLTLIIIKIQTSEIFQRTFSIFMSNIFYLRYDYKYTHI